MDIRHLCPDLRPRLALCVADLPGNERVGVGGCEGPFEGWVGGGREFGEVEIWRWGWLRCWLLGIGGFSCRFTPLCIRTVLYMDFIYPPAMV